MQYSRNRLPRDIHRSNGGIKIPSIKVNVTLPEEMKARYDQYQAENKARPLNLSAILQAGLDEILKKEGY